MRPAKSTLLSKRCFSLNMNDTPKRQNYLPDAKPQSRTREPFMPPNRWYRRGYEPQYFDGGLLPRIQRKLKRHPGFKAETQWSGKEKTFGENDYIDIFGDGKVRPIDLCKGPEWLRATRNSDFNILRLRLNTEGEDLKQFEPEKHDKIIRRFRYLYKIGNQRKKLESK